MLIWNGKNLGMCFHHSVCVSLSTSTSELYDGFARNSMNVVTQEAIQTPHYCNLLQPFITTLQTRKFVRWNKHLLCIRYSCSITGLEKPLGLHEVETARIVRQSAHEGGKVVSLRFRPPLPPGNILGTHLCYRLSRPQGHSAAEKLSQWKIFITSSGIEPATFRLVVQCLNQQRHHCCVYFWVKYATFIEKTFLRL